MSTSVSRVAVTVSVDTNVLLDLLGQDVSLRESAFGELNGLADEALIICEAVYAELANQFTTAAGLDEFLSDIGVDLVSSDTEVLFLAGTSWANYARTRPVGLTCSECGSETAASCGKCGAPLTIRQRVLPDFYVGAHAKMNAGRLLTHDRRHFRRYFPDLDLV